MKKLILLITFIITLTGVTQAQLIQAYDITGVKRFIRVDANGYLITTPNGGATAANQIALYNQLHTKLDSLKLAITNLRSGQLAPVRDSLYSNTGGSYPKILTYGYPTIANITLTNATATADTIKISTFCIAKNDYSFYNVGWRDISSGKSGVGFPDINESDNTLIIIPANTSRVLQSDGFGRVNLVKLEWYDTRGKATQKLYISYQKIY